MTSFTPCNRLGGNIARSMSGWRSGVNGNEVRIGMDAPLDVHVVWSELLKESEPAPETIGTPCFRGPGPFRSP